MINVPEKGWFYRVVEEKEHISDRMLSVVNVYHENYKPIKASKERLFIVGSGIEQIRGQLKRLEDATKLPVVSYKELEE